jgi:hypothetical protein
MPDSPFKNVFGLLLTHGTLASMGAAATVTAAPIWGASPIAEPYPYVSAGTFNGPAVAASPDPLVRYRWPNPKASDGLEIYLRKPESVTSDATSSFASFNSLLTSTPNVTVNGTGTIRVDFGRENAGWFEIDSPDCPGGMEMSISEYNEPEQTNLGQKTITPERIGSTYRAKFNNQYFEGVRFGFIHVKTFTRPWHITGIRLVCQVKPANYEGRFECSDPMLNKIWHVSAYCVKICNLKDFTTPILIERSDRYLWNGLDFYIYNTANLIAFGNYDFVQKQILQVNTPPGVDAGIAGFALYDVLGICDFYNYTGDTDFVRACQATACRKLDQAHERFTSYTNHGTAGSGSTGFMGWDERLGGFERVTSYNLWNYRMLCIRAWREFAKVMERTGNTAARDKYNGFADAKISELRQNRTWPSLLDVHGCAEAIQAGFCTRAEIETMCAAEFADRVNRVSYSQANTGLILQGMARAGRYDEAICAMKDQWGATIEYGGTTTFEMFHPSAKDALGSNDPPINGQCGYTSLCHPWGAMPCKYLNEEVLGIKPATPGFGTVDIFPHLGRKLTRVSGTTPTLKGGISASFDVASGKCRVTLPTGVTATVGIPKVEKTIKSITLNGILAWDGKYHPVAGIGGASDEADFVRFTSVPPGSYDFLVSYVGTTPTPADSAEVFPVKFAGEDSATHGNWGGKYGMDGYVLFNYDGVGKDVRVLPSYVTSVICDHERCANVAWTTNTTDVRASARDRSNSGTRSAAAIYTKDPEPTYQTMFADIAVSGTHEYTMALYFLDWDHTTRRVGVQVVDPQTLKQLAPVKVVRDYHAGKYLLYKYNRSVRVRIDTIKEPNATLSGIFFSP